MPLDTHDMHTLDAFARGTVSSIPRARQIVAALLSEVEAQRAEIARLKEYGDNARSAHEEACQRAREADGLRIHAETDLIAAQEEIAHLRVEAEAARAAAAERLDRLRATAATLVEEVGSQGPEDADQVATRAAAEIRRLRAGGCARDQRTTQFCAEAAARDEEIRRLRGELDAARPGVEWRPDAHGWEVGTRGSFRLVLQTGSPHAGWRLFLGDARIEDGPETGDAGKAACYAAWLRACGIAPATAKKDEPSP